MSDSFGLPEVEEEEKMQPSEPAFNLKDPPIVMLKDYMQSVKSYEADLNKHPASTGYRAVANNNGTVSFCQGAPDIRLFPLDWVESLQRAKLPITELECKGRYLAHLSAMEHGMTKEQLADKKLINRLEIARESAQQLPLHFDRRELQTAVNRRLEHSFSRVGVSHLLLDKNMPEFGLKNVIAIRLQNPSATKVFTQRQLAELGLHIRSGQQPIILFAPTIRTFFQRGGEELPISAATNQEQRDLVSGKLPVRQEIHNRLNRVFDVSQLDITESQRHQLLKTEQTPYTYEDLKEFAAMVKTPDGKGIKTSEIPMQGVSLDGFYDSATHTISINSGLHENLKLSEYIHRLAEAVTDLTSPSPELVRNFESHLVSAQLHAACGLELAVSDSVRLAEAFSTAKEPLGLSQPDAGSFAQLEGALARVNRSAAFVRQSLFKVVERHEQEAAQEQTQQQGFDKTKKQETAQQPTKEITNFMEQIR